MKKCLQEMKDNTSESRLTTDFFQHVVSPSIV